MSLTIKNKKAFLTNILMSPINLMLRSISLNVLLPLLSTNSRIITLIPRKGSINQLESAMRPIITRA